MSDVLGGSYKDITDSYSELGKGHGYQAHHVYAFNAYSDVLPISKEDGPAIRLESFKDHQDTASWGRAGVAYQHEQRDLLREGNFREAWMMDVRDIQSNFEDKYDTHLAYAERQLLELDKDKKVQLDDKFKEELGERQKTLDSIEKNQKEQSLLEKQEVSEKPDIEKREQLKQEAEKLKLELRAQYEQSTKEKSEIEAQRDGKSDQGSQSSPERTENVATPTKEHFSYDEFDKDEFDSFA